MTIHTELGNVLRLQRRFEEAIAAHQRTLSQKPDCAEAHCNLGLTLQNLGRHAEAVAAYREALHLKPDYVEAHCSLGVLLGTLGKSAEAIAEIEKAIALDPKLALAHYCLGATLKDAGRMQEALGAYRQALACDPSLTGARFELCDLRRHICDWRGLDAEEASCLEAVRAGDVRVSPFPTLAMPATTPADQLAHARVWARGADVAGGRGFGHYAAGLGRDGHGRVRIGYLSSDYCRHATAALITELIERHDRERFEVVGYCFSPNDGSDARQRLVAAFDRLVDIRHLSHWDAARQIHDDRIDVLVDLKGYTRGARTEILSYRPAPVQVSFLGYPGSMGAAASSTTSSPTRSSAPFDRQADYDERIVHLPDSYQPNDRRRQIADRVLYTRRVRPARAGLRVLRLQQHLQDHPGRVRRLDAAPRADTRQRAVALRGQRPVQGQPAGRGCQAWRRSRPARIRSQAQDGGAPRPLPRGRPVPRHPALQRSHDGERRALGRAAGHHLRRETFAARVAGSLLHAIGLPELVTHTLSDYEALALRLARDPAALAALRDRLERNRLTTPLFDTERYTRNMEAAYMHMVRHRASGQQPQAFAVADLARGDAAHCALAKADLSPGRIAYAACPLCGSADIPFHIEADTTRHALYKPAMPKTMKWRSCSGCNHVFTEGYYTEEMLGIVFSDTQANQRVGHDLEGQRKVSARIVERVAGRAGIGDWLDVGFGNAALLFTATEWGFTPVGVDLRKDNVETLRKLGMEAHCVPIEDMEGGAGRYSVISMADVLEHMPYPKAGLKAAHRLLRPGGVLFVSMPNMDSMVWRALDASGSNPYWGEIEHYHNFMPAAALRAARRARLLAVRYDISERYRCCMEVIAEKR